MEKFTPLPEIGISDAGRCLIMKINLKTNLTSLDKSAPFPVESCQTQQQSREIQSHPPVVVLSPYQNVKGSPPSRPPSLCAQTPLWAELRPAPTTTNMGPRERPPSTHACRLVGATRGTFEPLPGNPVLASDVPALTARHFHPACNCFATACQPCDFANYG